ncbi:MAG: TlpA family protein disulfide reductase [Saprospiraceae bacterium]|nr:TlpA family protein disulfide reductase [Saprospiraceae bacterium]MDW8483339.1 thioredoxin-like domain-containing protein [Saprospiraceae bacterium]
MPIGSWKTAVAIGILLLGGVAYWKYRQPRFVAGDRLADFSFTLADGRQVHLSDWKGKYVLIHFWGSWCGPCREENRELRRLYAKYRHVNFDIISIGIEQTRRAWEQALQTDSLVWPHHALELERFQGPLAKHFRVRAIPTTFLINPQGVIMGVNLSPYQLEHMLRKAKGEN